MAVAAPRYMSEEGYLSLAEPNRGVQFAELAVLREAYASPDDGSGNAQ